MSKAREKIIDLVIKNGENQASFTTALENGLVIGVEAHTNHTNIDVLAQLEITDDSGVPIVRKSHVNHWKRREGAGFNESYKPVNIYTESRTFSFRAYTDAPVTKDTYFQIILIYTQ